MLHQQQDWGWNSYLVSLSLLYSSIFLIPPANCVCGIYTVFVLSIHMSIPANEMGVIWPLSVYLCANSHTTLNWVIYSKWVLCNTIFLSCDGSHKKRVTLLSVMQTKSLNTHFVRTSVCPSITFWLPCGVGPGI